MKGILICFCVLLSACSTSYTTPVEKPMLELPPPSIMKLQPVKFKVIHKHNADKYFNEQDSSGKEPVVVALPIQEYKKLSINVAKIKAYIKAQQKIISLYRRYYESKKNDN